MIEKQVNDLFQYDVVPVIAKLQAEVGRILYNLTGKSMGDIGPSGAGGDREIYYIMDALAHLQMAGIGIRMILDYLDEQYEERKEQPTILFELSLNKKVMGFERWTIENGWEYSFLNTDKPKIVMKEGAPFNPIQSPRVWSRKTIVQYNRKRLIDKIIEGVYKYSE